MWLDDAMAPPHKRRRLSAAPPSLLPSRTTFTIGDSTPVFAHAVQRIAHNPTPSTPPRPPKHRVDEIHLQIKERPVLSPKDYYHHYPKRQDGTVTLESTITTVDAAGNTIISLVTNTLPTVTTPATTTTNSATDGAASNGTATSTGTGTGSLTSSSGSSSSNTNTTSSTGTGTGATTTSKSSSTFTSHNTNSTTTDSRTSTEKSIYLATLTDGEQKTLTRSDKPYITTFADGQQITVCDRDGDCQMSTQSSNDQSTSQQTFTSSDSIPPTVTSTTDVPGIAGPNSSPSSSSTSSSSNNDSSSTPPAGAIAGGVVGGAAGLAVILLIALIFLKYLKRRKLHGHQALPATSTSSPIDDRSFSRSGGGGGPGMAERAGLMPLVSAVPAFFRHSGHSSSDVAASPPAERGFTRVSGRKLPSQFSAGIAGPAAAEGDLQSPHSPPPTWPLNASSSSPPDPFYSQPDAKHSYYNAAASSPTLPAELYGGGFGGGRGEAGRGRGDEASPSNSLDRATPSPEGEIALSPGPRRTPTVHHGGPYVLAPSSSVPATPTIPARFAGMAAGGTGAQQPTYGSGQQPPVARTGTPSTVGGDERGSRFMEEV